MSRLFDEVFNKIHERFLNSAFFEMESYNKRINSGEDEQDFTEETFEVIKGDTKTTIVYRFNKEGFPVSHYHKSISAKPTVEPGDLKEQLKAAIKAEDYESAIQIRNQLRILDAQAESNGKTN